LLPDRDGQTDGSMDWKLCATFGISATHTRHLKCPRISSRRTSDFRLTVPERLSSFPI
jgi:hypothetical protein